MNARRKRSSGLPINPSALLEAVGLTTEQSTERQRLAVFVDTSLDAELLSFAKQALRPLTDNLIVEVTPYSDEPVPVADDSMLALILAAEAAATGRLLVRALKAQVPAVVATLDVAQLRRVAREHFDEIDPLCVVTASACGDGQTECFERLFAELGAWIVRSLPEGQLALARSLPFVRTPFVKAAIQTTSLQNAAIASLFLIPGADMPLLTLNQARLCLKIAAAYGVPLDRGRLYELALLILSAFGLRMLARRLAGLVPVVGWAIRGGVGYTGTLAMGLAAQEYFERGGDLEGFLRKLRSGAKAGAPR
ncbi:MAG: hypothetical protein LBH64_05000 [Coriobacteriales bacterium]|jgi:uncharacterized protein (DUF697 family)|nr:hypothetical protein [Coriobacteriales bacterium]